MHFVAPVAPIKTPARITRDIIDYVAWWHGVTYAAVMSDDRHAKVVLARRDAIISLMRAKPHMSLPQIGRIFGRDHSTVLHHAQTGPDVERKKPGRKVSAFSISEATQ